MVLDIWLPTYKRPHKLLGVMQNVQQTTKNPYNLVFGIEPDDEDSRAMLESIGAQWVTNEYSQGYSNTIQTLYEKTDGEFWFHANDDFQFLHHWDEVPLSMFADPKIKVVGIKQNEHDESYSALSMARRSYIDEDSGVIDMPKRVFYPYNHNYVDTEFTRTAQHRGVWAKCEALCINHLHPGFTGEAKDDTYKKNDATSPADGETFRSREHLWS